MSIAPLTPLEAHIAGTMPKVSRSLSMSSSLSSSSTSSTFSRSADDMLDRLVNQLSNSTFHLWSAGNVRLNNRDLTTPPAEAADLIESIKRDERFEIVSVTYLDVEGGEDWKLCVRRNHIVSPLSTPSLSDAE